MLSQYCSLLDVVEKISLTCNFVWEICCIMILCWSVFWLYFSSRYFHWKLNLCVILLILIFMVPFYIGYFVVSNIRLCEYLVCGRGAANLRPGIQMGNNFGYCPCTSLLALVLFWLNTFSLELYALSWTIHWTVRKCFTWPQQMLLFFMGFNRKLSTLE